MYEEARRLYTEEINAAVRGAKIAAATEIVVMDCHGAGQEWSFNSLVPELLDPDGELVVQQEWKEYTEFLEQGADAALFVGMHAMAGTRDGVLNHTVSGQVWQNLWFNGTLVGETGINAALCGIWGCPVLLVTGDDASCREGTELLGAGLTTVAVKRGLGAHSARQIPPVRARKLIEEGAKEALGRPRRHAELLDERQECLRHRRRARLVAHPLPVDLLAQRAGDLEHVGEVGLLLLQREQLASEHVLGAQDAHPHRRDLELVSALELMVGDLAARRPEDQVDQDVAVPRLEQPFLRGPLRAHARVGERLLRPLGILGLEH